MASRNAYALLGLSFLIVFGGAYFLLTDSAEAPTPADVPLEINSDNSIFMSLQLTSPAFEPNGLIPSLYTCDAENINPPLSISGVPEGTQSLVLVMDDPDIPEEIKEARGIDKFDHWAVYNLPADLNVIEAGATIGTLGNNSRGEATYTGPCPPTEYEPTTHRYIFRLYALSGKLEFESAPTLDEVETVAAAMMLEKTELIGLYSRVTEDN